MIIWGMTFSVQELVSKNCFGIQPVGVTLLSSHPKTESYFAFACWPSFSARYRRGTKLIVSLKSKILSYHIRGGSVTNLWDGGSHSRKSLYLLQMILLKQTILHIVLLFYLRLKKLSPSLWYVIKFLTPWTRKKSKVYITP